MIPAYHAKQVELIYFKIFNSALSCIKQEYTWQNYFMVRKTINELFTIFLIDHVKHNILRFTLCIRISIEILLG